MGFLFYFLIALLLGLLISNQTYTTLPVTGYASQSGGYVANLHGEPMFLVNDGLYLDLGRAPEDKSICDRTQRLARQYNNIHHFFCQELLPGTQKTQAHQQTGPPGSCF